MNKVSHWIQNFLLYSLPLAIVTAIWGSLDHHPETGPLFARVLWDICGWTIVGWFAALFIFMWLLAFHPKTREQIVRRLANIRERDEREEIVTGRASRIAFVSSLSVLLLLLFLSMFTLNIKKLPPEEVVNGNHGQISLGFQFHMLDDGKKTTDEKGEVVFESKDIPLSKSAILLGVILWQLGSFKWSSRKLLQEEA